MAAQVEGAAQRVDVVVIGAGLAGLACARALRAGGLDVVVLEARDRLGGRVHSADVDGCAVELGAQWVHDDAPCHPAREFAERAGLHLRPTSWEQAALVSGGERSSGAQIKRARDAAKMALDAARATRRTAKSGASLDDALRPLLEGADAATRFFVRLELDLDYGAEARELSLHYWDKDEFWGNGKGGDAIVVGSLSAAVAALAEGLDVRLEHVVTRVEVGADVLRVCGETFELTAERRVVAVPLGCLKRGALAFSPALSPQKTQALAVVGCAAFERVALAFDAPWWERFVGRRHAIYAPADAACSPGAPRFEFFFSLNAARGTADAPHILIAILGGADATAAEPVNDGTLRSLACDALDTALGSEAAHHCCGMVRTRWSRDEYSLGAYSYLRPGATPDDFDSLARPEHRGRVLFCGEHTSRKYPATMHGALLSGVREAKRIHADYRKALSV